jgi:hypothetical protein
MIKMVMYDRVKYRTKSCGERARQQRDRERGRDRNRVLLKMGDGVGNELEKIFMTDVRG